MLKPCRAMRNLAQCRSHGFQASRPAPLPRISQYGSNLAFIVDLGKVHHGITT